VITLARTIKALLALAGVGVCALIVLPYTVLLLPIGLLFTTQEMWVRGTLFPFLSAFEYGPAPSFVRRQVFEHSILLTTLQWLAMGALNVLLLRWIRSIWLATLVVCGSASLVAFTFIVATGVRLDSFRT
jgi:hypothetical protein